MPWELAFRALFLKAFYKKIRIKAGVACDQTFADIWNEEESHQTEMIQLAEPETAPAGTPNTAAGTELPLWGSTKLWQ